MPPTKEELNLHFDNGDTHASIASWWAEGTVGEKNQPFQSVGKAVGCHAGLFGMYGGVLRTRNQQYRENIKWKFLATNIFTQTYPVIPSKDAWNFAEYLVSEHSPWKPLIDTGCEIIEGGGYPRAFYFPNGEALSEINPMFIFNFLVAARIGTGDDPEVPINWNRFVKEGIHPTLAFLAGQCVTFRGEHIANKFYGGAHSCVSSKTSIKNMIRGVWSENGTEHSKIWDGRGPAISSLQLQGDEIVRTHTRFSIVDIGQTSPYIERIRGLQNEIA